MSSVASGAKAHARPRRTTCGRCRASAACGTRRTWCAYERRTAALKDFAVYRLQCRGIEKHHAVVVAIVVLRSIAVGPGTQGVRNNLETDRSGLLHRLLIQLLRGGGDEMDASTTGQPRLLLVRADVDPPINEDDLEDWVRTPADPIEVHARVAVLKKRAARVVPTLDDSGRLNVGSRWIGLTPIEYRLVRVPLEQFATVVTRDVLIHAVWSNATTIAQSSGRKHPASSSSARPCWFDTADGAVAWLSARSHGAEGHRATRLR